MAAREAEGGGTGSARRRRERRLRAYLKYARMSVAMALAECQHHSAPRGQRMARAREEDPEVHYTATVRTTDPPPEPVLFDLYEEPGGSRPNFLLEPQGPLEWPGAAAQPSLIEHVSLDVPKLRSEGVQEQVDVSGLLLQVTPQVRFSEQIEEHVVDVPVQQGIPQERITERISELIVDDTGPCIPQERITERISGLIVDDTGPCIPQERITERISELIVDDTGPCIPQERISERKRKQNVVAPDLQSIPQERSSERIQEPIIDAKRGTSSSAAVQLDTAECAVDGVFRTFPRKEKSATTRRELSPSSSRMPSLVEAALSWQDQRHGKEEFRPKRACKFFLMGCCQQGHACNFAHSARALHVDADLEQFRLLYYAGALG